MSTSGASRSQLIDYAYNHVASLVEGQRDGTNLDQITKMLEGRVERLQKPSEPFDKPSDASKKKIGSGLVQLPDGVSIKVEDADKELVFAISDRFQIDQLEALVLLRSFLYNEGLPDIPDSESKSSFIEELLNAITPFYYSERVYVTRTLIALIKCQQTERDPYSKDARKLLHKIIADPHAFTLNLIQEYMKKTKLPAPPHASKEPKTISQWAKQNAKEQLVLVECLFWMLWDYVPCNTPIVVAVYECAFSVDFGYKQENSPWLLDEEGMQIQRDMATLWILITMEVLNLEELSDMVNVLPSDSSESAPLYASPLSLSQLHKLVMAHDSPGYVCTRLAWAFYLNAVYRAASRTSSIPQGHVQFLREIKCMPDPTLKKGGTELHKSIIDNCIQPETGLFAFLKSLLTQSPLFVSSLAWRTGSSVTFPNDLAYRALLKGLLISLVDYVEVELIPDYNGFMETWIALFGDCESSEAAGLCRQYWDVDWRVNSSRRAVIDVARQRFPVRYRPLVRLLRAMSGATCVDTTDPELFAQTEADEPQQVCKSYVFYYFKHLQTYTTVLPPEARSGTNALYDRMIDRPGPSKGSGGTAYTNLKPLSVPGGSVIPQRSVGRLLCPDSATGPVVVAWQHEHSGWKVLVDVMYDYINRRQGFTTRALAKRVDVSNPRQSNPPATLGFDDIGIERDSEEDLIVADSLELVLSIVEGNVNQTQQLMRSLEEGGNPVSHGTRNTPPPDFTQLIFMILEDALSRASRNRVQNCSALVAPSLGILSALLSLPVYSTRVWLYLRSTTMLFGDERGTEFSSAALEAERASGQYSMTLALLRLVRTLLEEAIVSLLVTRAKQPHLQTIKEEVLLRALRYIHGQIWVEHSTWRYARLADRFEIGRSIIALHVRVLETMSSNASAQTFTGLSEFVSNIMIYQATSSTITPLIHTIASGKSVLGTLVKLRRFEEFRNYTSFLESSLRLTRLVLHLKSASSVASSMTLIEQALCSDHSVWNVLIRTRARVNPVDLLAFYARQRELGAMIPREAVRTLTALCNSLSSYSPVPSIVGYFSDARAAMASLVKILRHPYDDLVLRNALWSFVCVAVEKQPALAVLLVAGDFKVVSIKGKEPEGPQQDDKPIAPAKKPASAIKAACETVAGWKQLWEANPQLLASVLNFFDVVWSRSLEHITTLEPTRGDPGFWKHIAAIAKEELGPSPDYVVTREIDSEEGKQSDLHDAVSSYAYRTKVKSHALRVLGSDIAIHLRSKKNDDKEHPASYKELASLFQSEEDISESMAEAIFTSCDPALYDRLVQTFKSAFAPLTVDSLKSLESTNEHDYGDNFMLSVPLLRDFLHSKLLLAENAGAASKQLEFLVYSMNLNTSLATSQLNLAESWCFLLDQVKGYLRGDAKVRTLLLSTAATASRNIADERRNGAFMVAVHEARLKLLLALLEAIWFSSTATQGQTKSFILLLDSLHSIITSDIFPPSLSFLGAMASPFHRNLLQIVFFCAKNCQLLNETSQITITEYRLSMGRTFTAAMVLVIDALRLAFDTARTRLDIELDKDMELLVAVFQQCMRKGLHTSPTAWLTRCQETDVIDASLRLLGQTDLSGFSDLALLRRFGRPLYALHVLAFHVSLASPSYTAERLSSESVMATYCNNSITPALSEGMVDTALPELPGERNPAHKAYCLMLTNVTGIISNIASPQQFIESQIVGFIQLYGRQISRTLLWTNDDPLTLAFLEEFELTVGLFYLISNGSSLAVRDGPTLQPVLCAFTDYALQLLQQLNYALTHPKHLLGLIEPITSEERIKIERETSDFAVTTLNDLLDQEKRPIVTSVVRRLWSITGTVLLTLNILSSADTVFTSDPEEWPMKEALVVPHTKVTMGEPASIGTLIELGNCAYEVLNHLTTKAATATPSMRPALRSTVLLVRQTLEADLVYATTQLAMLLLKHDVEHTGDDMDLDDTQQQQQQQQGQQQGQRLHQQLQLQQPIPQQLLMMPQQPQFLQPPDMNSLIALKTSMSPTKERERRLKRRSITLADRLRRGMTGEITMDLQSLIQKAKSVMTKSAMLFEKPEPVNILQVLSVFLEERVDAPLP